MTTIELNAMFDQEVSSIRGDEQLMKKAIAYLRRLKNKAKAEAIADEDREPTKAEILAGIREGLQAIKDRKEGKDVTGQFCSLEELLDEL